MKNKLITISLSIFLISCVSIESQEPSKVNNSKVQNEIQAENSVSEIPTKIEVNQIENNIDTDIEKRKKLFMGIVSAQDKAEKDAEIMFPTNPSTPWFSQAWLEKRLNDWNQKQKELSVEYEAEFRRINWITEEEQKEILKEWQKNLWPFPEY